MISPRSERSPAKATAGLLVGWLRSLRALYVAPLRVSAATSEEPGTGHDQCQVGRCLQLASIRRCAAVPTSRIRVAISSASCSSTVV
jgi:hypothetical protein